ncbi:MAG: copper resistance CopC family protein [Nocardioides sp.]
MRRPTWRGLVLILLLPMALLPALAPAPALAHTELVVTSPAADPPLSVAPMTVSLSFTDPVIGEVSSVSVRGPDGLDHVDGAPLVFGGNLQARLTGLDRAGTYQVDFRVVGVDGHPVSGSWDFTLTAAAARGAAQLAAGVGGPAVGLASQGPSANPTSLALLLLALLLASTLAVRRVALAVHRGQR